MGCGSHFCRLRRDAHRPQLRVVARVTCTSPAAARCMGSAEHCQWRQCAQWASLMSIYVRTVPVMLSTCVHVYMDNVCMSQRPRRKSRAVPVVLYSCRRHARPRPDRVALDSRTRRYDVAVSLTLSAVLRDSRGNANGGEIHRALAFRNLQSRARRSSDRARAACATELSRPSRPRLSLALEPRPTTLGPPCVFPSCTVYSCTPYTYTLGFSRATARRSDLSA